MEELVDVVKAIHDYESTDSTCMSFKKNDILFIHFKDKTGWWDGTLNGQRGWFPSNFMSSIPSDDQAKYIDLYRKNNGKLFHNYENNNSSSLDNSINSSALLTPVSASSAAATYERTSSRGSMEQTLSQLMEKAKALENDIKFSTLNDSKGQAIQEEDEDIETAITRVSTTLSKANTIRDNSTSVDDSDLGLAPNWGRKVSPAGTVYYYNTRTNATTYSIEEARSMYPIEKKQSIRNSDVYGQYTLGRSRFSTTVVGDWNEGPSLIGRNTEPTWEIIVNNILDAVRSLNLACKNKAKNEYVEYSNKIVYAIRDMLVATGCTSSSTLTNPALKMRYSQVMSTLTKLSFAAKVASGLWPPPDADSKMNHMKGQILMAVKVFVGAAQEANIKLQPVSEAPLEEFSTLSVAFTDYEFTNKIDRHTEQIKAIISTLIKSVGNERCISEVVIDSTKEAVIQIGQFLSFVEEIQGPYLEGEKKDVEDFKYRKETLYITASDMLTVVTNSMNEYAPADQCVNILLDCTSNALFATDSLVLCLKCIVDKKETKEQESLRRVAQTYDVDERGNFELSTLQRRANGLKYVSSTLDRRSTASDINDVPGRNHFNLRTPMTQPQIKPVHIAQSMPNNSIIHDPASPSSPTSDKLTLESLHENSTLGTSYGKESAFNRNYSTSPRGYSLLSSSVSASAAEAKATISASFSPSSTMPVSSPLNVSKPDESQDQWFLSHDYNPDEITFNSENKITGGTLNALVERLTLHDQPADPNFTNAFMLLFTQFSTAKEFSTALIKRYQIRPPVEITNDELKLWREKKLVPIRLRVYNVFKSWLENYWQDNTDLDVLKDIEKFAKTDMMDGNRPLALRLVDLVKKKLTVPDSNSAQKVTKKITGDIPPPLSIPKNLTKVNLIDIHPLEVARQITLIESNNFNAIKVTELIGQPWANKNDRSGAMNVRNMTHMSNKITSWVISSIVMESDIKKRAAILKYFIKLGDKCLQLNNMNTLMAISTALNSSTITRLKKTYELLTQKTLTTLEGIAKATDHSRNYAEIRAHLKAITPPALPFLGLYLTDLTFTEDGNPTMRNAEKSIINMDKFIKISKIIAQLQRFQVPYALSEVSFFQSWLISKINDGNFSQERLYQESLKIEPRQDEGYDSQRDMDLKIKNIESNLK